MSGIFFIVNAYTLSNEPKLLDAFVFNRDAKFLLIAHSANQSGAANTSPLDYGAPSIEELRKCFDRLMGYQSGLDRIAYTEYAD
ncbi:hypothetical protein O9G_002103 [Rozella allomycis CSF55]|uniref:Uncharacterized protein n=1 Tax=Rozella allomycis (strain CSF55) TaxID=988480 RepID=A0A075B2N3_ROZAC|nr:hypothetical protein O9G_002103 [Rozella allomycis CSF55]|eukprot:EPZ36822.1 hypothetical protein O9G_002103 [Rozella allomycis CSF55]